jgi:hypothetical protein
MQNFRVSHFLLLHILVFEARLGPTDSNRVFVRRKIRSGGHDREFLRLDFRHKTQWRKMYRDPAIVRTDSMVRRHLASLQCQRLTQPTILPVGIWQQSINVFYWPCWWLRSLRSVLSISLWPRDPVFESHYGNDCISASLYVRVFLVTSWYLFQSCNSTSK